MPSQLEKSMQGVDGGNTIVSPPEPRTRGVCGIMGMPKADGHLKGLGEEPHGACGLLKWVYVLLRS